MDRTKKDLIQEINTLVNEINKDIRELERTGFAESSSAYDKIQQLRFDKMSYLTMEGYFRKGNSSLNKNQLEQELKILNKLKNMKSIKVEQIKKSTFKAFKTFNKYYRATQNRQRGITQKEYARARYNFAQWRKSNLSEIMGSDMVVQLSLKTPQKEFDNLIQYVNTHDEKESVLYINEIQKKYKLRDDIF